MVRRKRRHGFQLRRPHSGSTLDQVFPVTGRKAARASGCPASRCERFWTTSTRSRRLPRGTTRTFAEEFLGGSGTSRVDATNGIVQTERLQRASSRERPSETSFDSSARSAVRIPMGRRAHRHDLRKKSTKLRHMIFSISALGYPRLSRISAIFATSAIVSRSPGDCSRP